MMKCDVTVILSRDSWFIMVWIMISSKASRETDSNIYKIKFALIIFKNFMEKVTGWRLFELAVCPGAKIL